MDLSEFLLTRISHDESAIRKYGRPGPPVPIEPAPDWDGYAADDEYLGICISAPRALLECEAKRRIVEDQSGSYTWRKEFDALSPTVRRWGPGGPDLVEVSFDGESFERMTNVEFRERYMKPSPPSRVLKLLALPYADHPDYRQEWRP